MGTAAARKLRDHGTARGWAGSWARAAMCSETHGMAEWRRDPPPPPPARGRNYPHPAVAEELTMARIIGNIINKPAFMWRSLPADADRGGKGGEEREGRGREGKGEGRKGKGREGRGREGGEEE